MNKVKRLIKIRQWCLAIFVSLGIMGCSLMAEQPAPLRFVHREEGKHFVDPPLSEQWKSLEVINYGPGRFSFPPPAGYKIIQYANYSDNVSLDLYRELIDPEDLFADIINRRRKADHCKLNIDEEMAKGLPRGMEMLSADGNCYIWHQGEYRTKYYFLRVGYVVFTFCLTSGVKEYDKNLTDFTKFVNYTVKDYLVYPSEERANIKEYEYAYPISRDELMSFLQPAVQVAKKSKSGK